MAGYWIAFVEVNDPATYKEYGAMVPAAMQKYGGKLILRGTKREAPEGPDERGNTIVVQFPTYQAALDCYNSPEYQKAVPVRRKATHSKLMIVGDD